MGIKSDREDFNTTGIRGLLKRVMRERDEGFIRELPGGWRGEVVAERPVPGSGPYLHFRRGFPVMRYSNASLDDRASSEYQIDV
jgi:hypothetical protein